MVFSGCGSSNSASSLTMAVGHLRHALPDEASSPEQQQASTSAAVESSLTASSQRSADTASVPDAEEAQTSSSSAWQFAVENVVLHATVLRHMCQHSSDALSRSGQGVGAPALSASTQGAQSGVSFAISFSFVISFSFYTYSTLLQTRCWTDDCHYKAL